MNLVTSSVTVLWYCDSSQPPRKCKNLPCHGHRASADVRLVARVTAWFEGRDWDDVYMSEYRTRLRRAWQLLHRIRSGESPDGA